MHLSVVVLTNLTLASEQAARYAALLAEPLQLRLVLLHLYHAPELVTVAPQLAYRNQAETISALQELSARLPMPTDLTVSVQPFTDAVSEAVDQHQAGLLVMGLSAEHDALNHLLHNQALPILQATPLPLLLVPEAAARLQPPRRIALALDGLPFTLNEPSRRVLPLLPASAASYIVTHVASPQEREAFPGQRALAQAHLNELLPSGAAVETYEEHELAPAEGIVQALADTQADLLVLIARPRSFLGQLFHRSVTSQVLRQCRVPVLLLPAKAPSGWFPPLS